MKLDLTNEIFDYLTVIKEVEPRITPKGKKLITWECLCICGNKHFVRTQDLRKFKVKSCGCKTMELVWKNRTVSTEVRGLSVLYARYKKSAKARKLNFSLSKQEVLKITMQNCHYCAESPFQISKKYNNEKGYKYCGIDRIDNKQGYELNNVVSCCKICNRAKSDMSYDDFKKWVNKIWKNLN